MPIMVRIVCCTLAVDEQVFRLFVTGRFACRAARLPVLHLLGGLKWVFRPCGHNAVIKVKFGMGKQSPMPNFTFIGGEMWEDSPQNFEFCQQICPAGATRLHNFYEILSICARLQVAFNFVIWSLLGHLVAKLLNRSKKLGGAKMGLTSSITMPWGSWVARRL